MGGRGQAGGAPSADNLWQLSFPPFYTLQPHAETRRKQLDTWARIVLDYCRKKGLTAVNISDLADTAGLFVNDDIKRRASNELLAAVWEHLESRHTFVHLTSIKRTSNIVAKQALDLRTQL